MNGLIEILTTKKWMMSPSHLSAIREVLQQNLSSHSAFTPERKMMGRAIDSKGEVIKSYCIDEDGEYAGGSYYASDIKVPFVNVIEVCGPITRGGGGCSYGSVDHRDMILTAAENENCRGHVFYINTPGGSAWAKNDYQQAIEYARSKNQPVIAFIDGTCASAGMYLASLCDERYFMHPEDEIGCIGVMAAFYTEKDGGRNEYSNRTYHELYDPESFDKNRAFRDIANDDDAQLLINDLAALGREFRADVKRGCPTATNKHLHGRTFAAKDVTGILVDGQASFADCVLRCFGIADGTLSVIERPAPTPLEDGSEDESKKKCDNEIPIINNSYTMDEKYKILALACGVEALVISEEGTHLDLSLIDALVETLAGAEEKAKNMMDEQKTEAEKKCAAFEKQIEELKDDLTTAQESLKSAEQKLSDREAQIKELTEQAANAPIASPANNGVNGDIEAADIMPAYDASLSPAENKRIRDEWKAKHKA